ncbi:hypothetical protein PTI98_008818 [Pleurotus ostreatus]|nr:hypothetical protein PTI98_008818 [Pleurotus ostreatus]
MVWFTTKRARANHLAAGIEYVEEKEKTEVVLVGHSSGGGLSQILDAGDVIVAGLVMAASNPCYGSYTPDYIPHVDQPSSIIPSGRWKPCSCRIMILAAEKALWI